MVAATGTRRYRYSCGSNLAPKTPYSPWRRIRLDTPRSGSLDREPGATPRHRQYPAMWPMSAILVRSWQRKLRPLWLIGLLELQGHNSLGILYSEGKALEDGKHIAVFRIQWPELRRRFGGKWCACEEKHPGRPDDEPTGCGRSWYVRTMVATDGTVTLVPLPAAVDPRLAVARKALDDAGPKQLIDLRSAAEKWIGGVTALFSLFGLAGVTITRSTVTGLSMGWQLGIGIAAAGSIGLAGLAIYWIYRAAYGWPVTRPVSTDDEVLAWYEMRLMAPRVQAGYMRNGVRAAGGALATLVITVGLLWFAPQQRAAAPLVQATLRDGSRICGTLLPAAASGVSRIRRASDGTAVPIPVRSIVSLAGVTAC
jgi:hypothetical protein